MHSRSSRRRQTKHWGRSRTPGTNAKSASAMGLTSGHCVRAQVGALGEVYVIKPITLTLMGILEVANNPGEWGTSSVVAACTCFATSRQPHGRAEETANQADDRICPLHRTRHEQSPKNDRSRSRMHARDTLERARIPRGLTSVDPRFLEERCAARARGAALPRFCASRVPRIRVSFSGRSACGFEATRIGGATPRRSLLRCQLKAAFSIPTIFTTATSAPC